MTEQTLARLHSDRAHSGHPEAVHREGRRLLWDETQMLAWAGAWDNAKKAALTEVDRSGDPDELVDIDEAARLLGYANRHPIDSYRARRTRGYFPDPDDPTSRRWHRRTLWAFADRRSRPGARRPPGPAVNGSTSPRSTHQIPSTRDFSRGGA